MEDSDLNHSASKVSEIESDARIDEQLDSQIVARASTNSLFASQSVIHDELQSMPLLASVSNTVALEAQDNSAPASRNYENRVISEVGPSDSRTDLLGKRSHPDDHLEPIEAVDPVAEGTETSIPNRPNTDEDSDRPKKMLVVDFSVSVSAEAPGYEASRDSPVPHKLPANPAPSKTSTGGRATEEHSRNRTPVGELGGESIEGVEDLKAQDANNSAGNLAPEEIQKRNEEVKQVFGSIDYIPVENRVEFTTAAEIWKKNEQVKEIFGDIENVPEKDRLQFSKASDMLRLQSLGKRALGELGEEGEQNLQIPKDQPLAAQPNKEIRQIVEVCLIKSELQKELIQNGIQLRLAQTLVELAQVQIAVEGDTVADQGFIAISDILDELEPEALTNSKPKALGVPQTDPVEEQDSRIQESISATEQIEEVGPQVAATSNEINVVPDPISEVVQETLVSGEIEPISVDGALEVPGAAVEAAEHIGAVPEVQNVGSDIQIPAEEVVVVEPDTSKNQTSSIEPEPPALLPLPPRTLAIPSPVWANVTPTIPSTPNNHSGGLDLQHELDIIKASISKLQYLGLSGVNTPARKPMSLNEKLILKSLLDKYTHLSQEKKREREERWTRSCTLLSASKPQIQEVLQKLLKDFPSAK